MREDDAEAIYAYLIEAWPEPPVTPELRESYLANLRGIRYAVQCRRAVEALRFSSRERPTALEIYDATDVQVEMSQKRGEAVHRDVPAYLGYGGAGIPLSDEEHDQRAERVRCITDEYLRSVGLPTGREPGQRRRDNDDEPDSQGPPQW